LLAGVLLDQAFVHQLLQQPVRGGLRVAQRLGQVADALAALGRPGGQRRRIWTARWRLDTEVSSRAMMLFNGMCWQSSPP
jgi:hypothetical protein